MLMPLQCCIVFAMTLPTSNKLILICIILLTLSISAEYFLILASLFAILPWLCKPIGLRYFLRVFDAAAATCCKAAMQNLRSPHR
jgi:hypothetical protein